MSDRCHFCKYLDDFVYVPECGFNLCTHPGQYRYSCFEKYNLRKLNNLKLDVDEYENDDYNEMKKSYHDRIMDLQRLLSDAIARIDALESIKHTNIH